MRYNLFGRKKKKNRLVESSSSSKTPSDKAPVAQNSPSVNFDEAKFENFQWSDIVANNTTPKSALSKVRKYSDRLTNAGHHEMVYDIPGVLPGSCDQNEEETPKKTSVVSFALPYESNLENRSAIRKASRTNERLTDGKRKAQLLDLLLSMGYNEMQCRHLIFALSSDRNVNTDIAFNVNEGALLEESLKDIRKSESDSSTSSETNENFITPNLDISVSRAIESTQKSSNFIESSISHIQEEGEHHKSKVSQNIDNLDELQHSPVDEKILSRDKNEEKASNFDKTKKNGNDYRSRECVWSNHKDSAIEHLLTLTNNVTLFGLEDDMENQRKVGIIRDRMFSEGNNESVEVEYVSSIAEAPLCDNRLLVDTYDKLVAFASSISCGICLTKDILHFRSRSDDPFNPPFEIEAVINDDVSIGDLTQSTWATKNENLSADVDNTKVFNKRSCNDNPSETMTDHDDISFTELTVGDATIESILDAKKTLKHYASQFGVKSLLNENEEATIATIPTTFTYQDRDFDDSSCDLSIGSDTKASIENAKDVLKRHSKTLGSRAVMSDSTLSVYSVATDNEGDEFWDHFFFELCQLEEPNDDCIDNRSVRLEREETVTMNTGHCLINKGGDDCKPYHDDSDKSCEALSVSNKDPSNIDDDESETTADHDDISFTELTVGDATIESILHAKKTLKHYASQFGVKSLLNENEEATIATIPTTFTYQDRDFDDSSCDLSIGSDTKASIGNAKEVLKRHSKTLGSRAVMSDSTLSVYSVATDNEGDEFWDHFFFELCQLEEPNDDCIDNRSVRLEREETVTMNTGHCPINKGGDDCKPYHDDSNKASCNLGNDKTLEMS